MSHNVTTIREGILRRQVTARATVELAVNAAEELNESLNAFLEINRDGALQRAEEVDAKIKSATETAAYPALAGVPIAIKDNICVKGLQTSCGSRILGPYK